MPAAREHENKKNEAGAGPGVEARRAYVSRQRFTSSVRARPRPGPKASGASRGRLALLFAFPPAALGLATPDYACVSPTAPIAAARTHTHPRPLAIPLLLRAALRRLPPPLLLPPAAARSMSSPKRVRLDGAAADAPPYLVTHSGTHHGA